MTIPITARVGDWRTRITLREPTDTPNADGGYTTTYAALDPPAIDVSLRPAGPRDLERASAGTVSATATHVVEGWYHAGITTRTQFVIGSRVFSVLYVGNPDGLGTYMQLLAAELVA